MDVADTATAVVARCSDLVRGRTVVVVGGVAAGFTELVRQLITYGGEDVMVLAQGLGTGELPSDEARIVIVPGSTPVDATTEVRAAIEFADQPPAESVAAMAAFDPDGDALCLLNPVATVDRYLGRETLGGRRPEIAVLEDKTIADELWDAAGVRRAPATVVPVEADALAAAHASLDRGEGTVWSGDAADGMNGGADRVRWVRTEADLSAAVALFRASNRQVRVMPFLEGVPCSIHGFVLPDGVAVLRPVEQVVLRRTGSGRFTYAGLSSCWDPPAADREEMRRAAAAVGELLADRFGLRGAFAVDGVLTADGFLPTELNPRFSGGMAMLARGLPDLPLTLAQMAAVRGIDIGVSVTEFERLLVEAADASRSGGASAVTSDVRATATETVLVAGGPQGLVEATSDGAVGSVELGPAAVGGLVRYRPAVPEPGLRMAPYAVAALHFADERWGTAFGPHQVAPDVRLP